MSIIAEFTIESAEFPLGQLISSFPDLSVEIERVVPSGRFVMPYIWVYGDDVAAFEESMRETASVTSVTALDRLEDSALFKIEWEDPTEEFIRGIAATDGTILEARGDEEWSFRVRFPDHTGLAEFSDYCRENGFTYRLERVYALADTPGNESIEGLTEAQYEVLDRAVERGYFKVPRGVTFAELAAELGISEQAVSERVRRGADTVLRNALNRPREEKG